MKKSMLTYIDQHSPIHALTGATKLLCFLGWTFATIITYDTRLLLFMFCFSIMMFKISKISFHDVAFVLYFILLFLLLNNIAIYLFSPIEGVKIYGTRHDVLHLWWRYDITLEQIFYQSNITLKYFTVIPFALLFLLTTHPSEFAASLNRIGVNYKISYAISIALRYIPDIQRDFQNISITQQTRGIDLSQKEKLTKRIKNVSAILFPLILSSLQRIDTVSSAMELRRFGSKRKRTWYYQRSFQKKDTMAIIFISCLILLSIWTTIINKGRFFNPFT
ncbi:MULTISPECIES: energy-coupling factor transporter transmembrane component T family protein [Bacillus]|uniref:energy-coupling factor transporter transmembrane component T family protein n=1 Tax=Bacillus TaxID=1386 RepID=UPI0002DA16B9|nr:MULTISPECIES: energy-coupling factor transporter transmembrane component T [Bacillus]